MKFRVAIVIVSLIIILFTCIKYTNRIHNQLVDIDYIEAVANAVKKHCKGSRNIYYLANSNAIDLYYKTQLAFAPYVLVKAEYDNIPADSLIISVIYSNNTEPNTDFYNLPPDNPILFSEENAFLKLNLTKKQR